MNDPKSEQSSSEADVSEPLDTTGLRQACLAAGFVLEDWQERFLVSLITTREERAVSRFTQRLTRFYTATAKTSSGQLSTSPESRATAAGS